MANEVSKTADNVFGKCMNSFEIRLPSPCFNNDDINPMNSKKTGNALNKPLQGISVHKN
jgi:hypothetical protein